MRRLASVTIAVVLLLLTPLAGQAHRLLTQRAVTANEDGSFSIDSVFIAGPGTATVAAYQADGLHNLRPGLVVGDCFCTPECSIEDGERMEFRVVDDLIDPAGMGLLSYRVSLCDEPDLTIRAWILPFGSTVAPIPTLSRWGLTITALVLLATGLMSQRLVRTREQA